MKKEIPNGNKRSSWANALVRGSKGEIYKIRACNHTGKFGSADGTKKEKEIGRTVQRLIAPGAQVHINRVDLQALF